MGETIWLFLFIVLTLEIIEQANGLFVIASLIVPPKHVNQTVSLELGAIHAPSNCTCLCDNGLFCAAAQSETKIQESCGQPFFGRGADRCFAIYFSAIILAVILSVSTF